MAKAKSITEAIKEKAPKTVKAAVSGAIKGISSTFDLTSFKKSKNLGANTGFKKQEWIPLSDAFNKAIGLPGIPKGHISLVRGKSDSGKSTAFNEAVTSAQRLGDLPILLISEMKFSWSHLIESGFQVEETVDTETGEVTYIGDFIYIDRSSIQTIEDVSKFIMDLLNSQKRGSLPLLLAHSMPAQLSSPFTLPCTE